MSSLARLAAIAALLAATVVHAAALAGNEGYAANLRIDKRLVPVGAGAAHGSVHRRTIESETDSPMSTSCVSLPLPRDNKPNKSDQYNPYTSSFTDQNATVFMTVYGEQAQTYTLDKTGGSFGEQNDLVPVTVLDVSASDDCAALQDKLTWWETVDDVFTTENFMKGKSSVCELLKLGSTSEKRPLNRHYVAVG
jgi:hypothetical protein